MFAVIPTILFKDVSRNTWENDPNYLRYDSSNWPKNLSFPIDLPVEKRTLLLASPLLMQCIFAYVYKFAVNEEFNSNVLTPFGLKMGTNLFIRSIQQIHLVEG